MKLVADHQDRFRDPAFPLVAAGILALLALVYWPAHLGSFIWDDNLLIHDNAWLSVGSRWQSIVFHGLDDWRYFRPLGLFLFFAETRLFGVVPGPMHLVSLTMHLTNAAIVGALAWRLCPGQVPAASSKRLACIAMLIYGLHPAMVEPVAWISCQCDPLTTLFVLLGLLANDALSRTWMRVALVTTCFFAAACSKESAAAFPILLVLLDWMKGDDRSGPTSVRERFQALIRRQRFVYLGLLAAGIFYLLLRHLARVKAGAPYESDLLGPWARMQAVSFTYMAYWRMIVWPFAGISPAHIIPDARFTTFSLASFATDIAALGVGVTGLVLAWRRHPLGILIVGATAALLPVLHVIPIAFEDSLYHERYAMPAIAWACILIPAIVAKVKLPAEHRQIALKASVAVAACWLVLATMTVRTTLPLWSNDHRMWEWAVKTNPDSIYLMSLLLNADIGDHNLRDAAAIAQVLEPKARSCAMCMMQIATLALLEGDSKHAAAALQFADASMGSTPTRNTVLGYVALKGNLLLLDHDETGAEAAFRDAISIDPMHPGSYLSLALLLAGEGRADEARKVFDQTLALSSADQVDEVRQKFAAAMAMGAARTRAGTVESK